MPIKRNDKVAPAKPVRTDFVTVARSVEQWVEQWVMVTVPTVTVLEAARMAVAAVDPHMLDLERKQNARSSQWEWESQNH